jgi:hypothetical protein
MPELACSALDRAESMLTDMYVVKRSMIDCGSERTLACFATLEDACSFMDGYTGCGDYLHCYLGEALIAGNDLWFGSGVEVFEPEPQTNVTAYDPDEDIPF